MYYGTGEHVNTTLTLHVVPVCTCNLRTHVCTTLFDHFGGNTDDKYSTNLFPYDCASVALTAKG
jgi:hypothetical protein